ncbi:hypothetical protein IEE87_27455 (plasmid) [Klebsiella pneumoniae]|nr:hypothetical protein IEE87_27455 [Klebsiella pneumoniae]
MSKIDHCLPIMEKSRKNHEDFVPAAMVFSGEMKKFYQLKIGLEEIILRKQKFVDFCS